MARAIRPGLPKGTIGLALFVILSIALLIAFAPAGRDTARAAGLSLLAPLPDAVPPGTTLIVGDPVTEWIFSHNGWEAELPFAIKWARITGGPDVTEAFHARALDVGMGANVPPLHAHWVGLPVRIVAVRGRADPVATPAFVWATSPKAGVTALSDLKGKRIAFSPSQVQGQIVIQTLRSLGLTTKDVTLVELPSSVGGDVYTSALSSGIVDAAPIGGGIVAERYLRKFGDAGARVLRHPPFRDDLITAFVPVHVLEDPAKAAALRHYVRWWGRAQAWAAAHPAELARGYYEGDQGLSPADARMVVAAAGTPVVPAEWREAAAYQQAAIDLLAPQFGRERFDAATLFDRRFEPLAHEGSQP
ncbi:ABC transporter substrate-binding protein [Sphingomonas sp. Y38-1Y]|uniref:ABC transporter substrate-binding protein n=1 Tax=Sphingomonas sp. Y38-1Y TaxID=3078265 RepID=UPI0028E83F3C|nr:ABC transporter substrate-binding protein [Sphingomonas sp. Y38-1Y]